ncbi:MAG: O-antigen ligase family protein [Bacteroidetes bacterium]|nr:MAG: O-antigen ligase family protein [Bacteroidota bacterium]
MLEKIEVRWFYLVALSVLGISLFFLSKEMYFIAALPLMLVVLYLFVFRLDLILYTVVLTTPLAIVINNKTTGPAVSVPTEPLLFGLLLLTVYKLLFEGRFDKRILAHPVSIAIAVLLGWMFITSLSSSYPVVSFKYLLSQCWLILPVYLMGTQLFRKIKNIKTFIWLYASTLMIVIAYTIIRHAMYGWTQKAAHSVMWPFYNDHTAYAAAIALFIPVFISFTRDRSAELSNKLISFFTLLILSIAMILSYTRAAWISLFIAALVYLIFHFRIRFYKVAILGLSVLAVFLYFRTDIMLRLEQNRQDSATDMSKHLKSISNISTDASNLERINRWSAALRMFEERPLQGWGPGTYQFNYAPYQKSSEKTIISTNAGDMGNAHSEYIGPLSEQGVPGLITILSLVIAVFYTGTVLYSSHIDPAHKNLLLGILRVLVTYFAHGILNNFLDTDKLAVPVWGFISIIVSLDVYHRKASPEKFSGFSKN